MKPSVGRQCGVLVFAGFLATVSSYGAVHASAIAEGSACIGQRNAGEGSGGETGDKDGEASDLGVQPVLLWDRIGKPFRIPGYEGSACPMADTIGPGARVNTVPFQVDRQVQAIVVLLPRRVVGSLPQPHGPPW